MGRAPSERKKNCALLGQRQSQRQRLGWAASGRGLIRWPRPVKHSENFSISFLFFQKLLNNRFAQLLNSI
jgi:hypothetical protein